MSDNLLKKEFNSRDVQRMRNIITKKINDKTGTQVGYTKEYVEHKEGDVWEERGKKWTIMNGIKQTVTRLDSIKKEILMPITCPECHKPMTNIKLDKYMYSIHKKCFECVINYETQLKQEGKFEEYAKNINKQGIKFHIKEMEDILLELSLEKSIDSFVTEAGDIEVWKGKTNNDPLIEDIKEYISKLKDNIN